MGRVILACLCLISVNAFAFDVYLVRHFEKQTGSTDPELTSAGELRAHKLAELLKEKGIEQVFSTDYRRTQMTATPTAEVLGIEVQSYDPRALQAFAKQVLESKQNVLIVGHSNTTPDLVRLLGGEAQELTEKDYGDVFVLHIDEGVRQQHWKLEP